VAAIEKIYRRGISSAGGVAAPSMAETLAADGIGRQ